MQIWTSSGLFLIFYLSSASWLQIILVWIASNFSNSIFSSKSHPLKSWSYFELVFVVFKGYTHSNALRYDSYQQLAQTCNLIRVVITIFFFFLIFWHFFVDLTTIQHSLSNSYYTLLFVLSLSPTTRGLCSRNINCLYAWFRLDCSGTVKPNYQSTIQPLAPCLQEFKINPVNIAFDSN